MEALTSRYPWVKRKTAYWVWLNTVARAIAGLCRLRVYGRENVPAEGPVLLVANHRSYLDPPLVAYAVKKRPVFFMAKSELFTTPVLSTLIKHWGNAFPVKRGRADLTALKTALEVLEKGELVCIFPEGQRAPAGRFVRPKWGAGMVALKARVPIVPCLIEGSEKLIGKEGLVTGWPKVTIRFGRPFTIDLEDSKENYQRAANLMMERIKELQNGDKSS
ncbi:1-acyl-sn-glycerol-3-phosphate acyltransferase [Thermovibrio ammonificans HB-1]|uniref:1-acyl-sn-glycerol-3-phosphate acyltransferase n=1 Tax=Thermovibrio ammonificans (strain DSM 15698 / JCM 12110 / HB-1) TaxID=648996 RepID=E8T5S3_THEA1|nr:lysophospholipid acyltransferase family protein [Thermovibrio ammonificans]ADU97649.1 1-acyl-sn-glycerol-3-phosphate acyltransferase [Thermovibrio ammonificans HB-1]